MSESVKNVEELIKKAADACDSQEATRYAQAAMNAANALCALANYKHMIKE